MKIGMGNLFRAENSIFASNLCEIAYLTLFGGNMPKYGHFFKKNGRISMTIGVGNIFRVGNSNLTSNLSKTANFT